MPLVSKRRLTPLAYATLFLSSFLLFLVEPMQGKLLLPLLGGTSAVWNTCLVFFQATLLLGYLYAHLLTTRVPPRHQAWVHLAVVLLPALLLPLSLPAFAGAGPSGWGKENPALWLLVTLALSSGPAFFALATTSPLLQAWHHRTTGGKDPYVLYAAGNAGSFLALLAYPLVCEPLLHLGDQATSWTAGYLLFATAVTAVGFTVRRLGGRSAVSRESGAPTPAPTWTARLSWILLAAVPSSLMLGVTQFMTADVAAIPMLWTLPLALYLFSYVLVFAKWTPAADRWLGRLVPWLVATVLFLVFADFRKNLLAQVVLHLVGFLAVALACHGRLALKRPAARHLTDFYVCLSLGGVLGGLFNALAAPLIFSRVAEYPLVLALAVALVAGARATPAVGAPRWRRGPVRGKVVVGLGSLAAAAAFAGLMYGVQWLMQSRELEPLVAALQHLSFDDQVARTTLTYGLPLALALVFFLRPLYMGAALAGFCALALFYDADGNVLFRSRNFYGVLTVKEYPGGLHSLVNGGILHGEQKVEGEVERFEPRSYYHKDGPLGEIMGLLTQQVDHPHIAAVGLGAGTVAAYGTRENTLTFYELNPEVERLARDTHYFTYVDDCLQRGCNLSVVLGDGRLSLAASSERYDLIILDAFNSDAIPVHLLTREALKIYRAHLNPGGIVAYHISNRYLDLEPVLLNLGKEQRLIFAVDKDDGDDATGRSGSTWVTMAENDDLIGYLLSDPAWAGLTPKRGIGLWADDYANVARAFTWY